ncbi:MAG: insulinase family protein [Synechococcales cyanobacterium T60_A2020_003]|nr:insulinase family protein [Synechococcales cyanobacterium T60_A2020_003]
MNLKELPKLAQKERFPASVSRLPNGLTVVHQHVAATPVVTVDVWVRAGARVEPLSWSGIAHFLEHMIFKGSDRLPPGYFDHVIESRGGITNAATSHDYAHFFITTAASYLPETLPCLAELLLNAAIPEDEYERERLVVLEELRQAQDDPDWLGFQALMAAAYPTHPYGRSVLGTEESLMAQTAWDMHLFHRTYYQPQNMTVAVVGDVSQLHALDMVESVFRTFPQCETPCLTPKHEPERPLDRVQRQEISLPRLEQARLMMAWTGPGVDQLREAYGLDLLSVLLAGSQSSRLVRELREKKHLVQDISSSFSLQQQSSVFTLTAWLPPENLERVEALIGDRLSELVTHPILDVELNRHKRLLCNDYTYSTETTNQLAGLYGYYGTIAHAEVAHRYPEQIRSLTVEELRYLANKYLSPYRYTVTVLKPE